MIMDEKKKNLVLLGSGGHASVVASLANSLGLQITDIAVPNTKMLLSKASGIRYLNDEALLQAPDRADYPLINGIGQKIGCKLRADIFTKFKNLNFKFLTLTHPFSYVDPSSQISEGAQIMAGAIVQSHCFVGENSILNTNSSIDHGCKVGSSCHIAPGAVLCGDVVIGNNCFIGAGAIVTEGTKLANDTIVKAGRVIGNKQT